MAKGRKEIYQKRKNMMKKLKNYSVINIQRVWKGYMVRKYQLPQILKQKTIGSKIIAFVKGWKVRKVMKDKCQEIATLIKQFNEMSINLKRSQNNPHH